MAFDKRSGSGAPGRGAADREADAGAPGKRTLAEQDTPAAAFAEATAGPGGDVPHRAQMERAFGRDFSGVKAYVGQAGPMQAISANAAAQGEQVAFKSSSPDARVVAHELTHVVQGRTHGSAPLAADTGLSRPDDPAEHEAHAVADHVAGGGSVAAMPIRQPIGGQIARDTDYGPQYNKGADAVASNKSKIGKDDIHAPLQAASDFAGPSGKHGTKLDPKQPLTLADLEFIFIPANGVDAKTAAEIRAVLPDRVTQLNDAFRIMQIDTAEAQAVYLANSYAESWQLRKFSAEADPSSVGKFQGRGPLQVTNQENYTKALAYLDAEADRLEAVTPATAQATADAKAAREASAAVKRDPKAAADPKYAALFSAAYMHAAGRGGVKAAASLSGVNPTFGGNGPEDTWMTGGENIAGQVASWTKKVTDGTSAVTGMADGPDKVKAQQDLDHAKKRLAYWQSVQQSAARKDAAYDRAMTRLKPKALPTP